MKPEPDETRPRAGGRLRDIAAGRCPRCRRGPVFAGTVRMHEQCPVCALRFEREPGYFVGAMYVSYALSVPIMAALVGLVWLARPSWSWPALVGAATAAYLPLVPRVFRTARVLWIHLDRALDPD